MEVDRQPLRETLLACANKLLSERIDLARSRLRRKRAEIRTEDAVGNLAVSEANVKMAVSTETTSDNKPAYTNETQRKAETEKRLKEDRWTTHWDAQVKRLKRKLLRMGANEEVQSAYIRFNESLVALYLSDLDYNANHNEIKV